MTRDNKSRGIAPEAEPREESLLDDAIEDTFPASDPVAHGQPGSIVNLRYAALEDAQRSQRSGRTARSLLLMGAACACVFVLARRRKR